MTRGIQLEFCQYFQPANVLYFFFKKKTLVFPPGFLQNNELVWLIGNTGCSVFWINCLSNLAALQGPETIKHPLCRWHVYICVFVFVFGHHIFKIHCLSHLAALQGPETIKHPLCRWHVYICVFVFVFGHHIFKIHCLSHLAALQGPETIKHPLCRRLRESGHNQVKSLSIVLI